MEVDRRFIAFLAFLLSLLSFISILIFYDCPAVPPKDIGKYVGNCVTVRGILSPMYTSEGMCVYRIESDGTARAVEFGTEECTTGYACVEGRVQIWRGEPEIVILRYC
ncbi:MAG: hypothetical protein PWP76_742 [Candidatus Diapherotrites archaeon]|nr:hypothetical protein [Candidatus Diapherotrites archaeon]MDN5367274.1 hypothetical protein [Candidatus Diapherotrites archaeon]